ncbi:C4b-binding protein beta chain-like isoform X2 [Xiphophorus couchianus]|uniref:C4b-binding protein beta chain-like isoform X2 n=1 Tax=Xiphophorus couchianus TaxID=32473 RepID=UPI001016F8D5|nr:C4b-binding protein beta chain-like isoform X2 [Xiphophorus couchianus]
MKPLWFMFLVLQAFLSVEFSWSQNVNTCEIGVLDPNLYVSGLTPTCGTMKPGHKLCFVCGPDYQLDGSKEIECLPTGQWSASFPSCSEKCRIPDIPSTVRITSSVQGNAISKGDTLSFDCRQQDHIMQGSSTSSCLGNGKWSTPPPECTIIPYMEQKKRNEPKTNFQTKFWVRTKSIYPQLLHIVQHHQLLKMEIPNYSSDQMQFIKLVTELNISVRISTLWMVTHSKPATKVYGKET